MKKLYLALLVLILFSAEKTSAQNKIFGPFADLLQTSTQSQFYNSTYKYYYATNKGNANFNYWWHAHGLDAVLDGYLRTHSAALKIRMKNLLLGLKNKNGGVYPTTFYDDMAWLGLSSLRAYENTGDAEYLSAVNALWTDMKTGKQAAYGGAIQWNKSAPYSLNACTNGPAIILATRLYNLKANAADLQTAKDIYTWMKSALVNPTTGEVWDSFNSDTKVTNKSWIFSYNQGTWIGACLELYKTTGETTYLDDALRTATTAVKNNIGGILYPNSGGGDGGLFHGIFVRYLYQLIRETQIPADLRLKYASVLKSSALILKDRGTNLNKYIVSPQWGVAPGVETDYSSQLSGLMLIELASTFDMAGLYSNDQYRGKLSWLPVGNYNFAALYLNGIDDNSISSISLPPGMLIKAYELDNFTGDSVVFSQNQPVLNTWNNKISSLKIFRNDTISRMTNVSGLITLYTECEYAGYFQGFKIGDFLSSDITETGIKPEEIASAKITEGYKVIFYTQDEFTGDSIVLTRDSNCISDFKGKIHSMRVKANGSNDLVGSYQLQNKLTKFYMEVLGTADGSKVNQARSSINTTQQFFFEPIRDGIYRITSLNSGKPLEIAGVSQFDGGLLQQMSPIGGDNQYFIVFPGSTGYYKIAAKHSGKILEIQDLVVGASVRQWANTNQTDGQWVLKKIPSATESIQDKSYQIFPNPVTDKQITIQLPKEEVTILSIFNLLGEQLLNQKISDNTTISLKQFLPGTYLLTLQSDKNNYSKKLMVY